jgi:hypothetical protein
MIVVPISLREANDFVEAYHRHSGRTSRDGGKFAIGASENGVQVGVAIVGRPVAKLLNDSFTAEVLRLCVTQDAPKGSCSFLYGASWRAWRALGGLRLITYTMVTEGGASLRGAGWKVIAQVRADSWDRPNRDRRWQPIYGQQKFRWEIAVG